MKITFEEFKRENTRWLCSICKEMADRWIIVHIPNGDPEPHKEKEYFKICNTCQAESEKQGPEKFWKVLL